MARKKRKFDSSLLLALGVMLVVVLIQVMVFRNDIIAGWERYTRHPLDRSATRVEILRALPDTDPPLMLVQTRDGLVVTVELRTGVRRGEVALGRCEKSSTERLRTSTGSRAFLHCGETSVRAVDLSTGELLWDLTSAASRHPELALGVRLILGSEFTRHPTSLPLRLHDGRRAWIDIEGELSFDTPPPAPPARHRCRNHCAHDLDECYDWSDRGGGIERILVVRGQHDLRAGPLDPWDAGFIDPRLVRIGPGQCVSERGESFWIEHLSAAFEPREVLLSRVERSGRRRWTLPMTALDPRPGAAIHRIHPLGDVDVLVVGHNPEARHMRFVTLVHLDPATGEILAWHPVAGTGHDARPAAR